MLEAPQKVEKLDQFIYQHLLMTDEIKNLGERIYSLASEDKVVEVAQESENRGRLINILNYLQNKIENEVDALPVAEMPKEKISLIMDNLKKWQIQFNKEMNTINEYDLKTMDILEDNKSKTIAEISLIHKVKEQLRGYNLNNVKK